MNRFARRVFLLPCSAFAALLYAPVAMAQCTTDWVPGFGLPGVTGNIYDAVWWDPDGVGPRGDLLIVGGNFQRIFTAAAENLASWDPATGEWEAWPPSPNNDVFSLAVMPNGDLVVGGWFTSVGGTLAANVARFDGTSWSALSSGVTAFANPVVSSLVPMPNGDLIAAGSFYNAGGVACNSVARWDGAAWSPLGSGVSGQVFAAGLLPGGDVVVGGNFGLAGQMPASAVARWDGSTWHALGAGVAGPFAVDRILVEPSGDVLVGGGLTSAGGQSVSHLARWDGSSWSGLGSGPSARVRSLFRLPNGDLLAGVQSGAVERWDGQTWSPLGAGVGAPANALVELAGGDVLAVGYSFSSFRGAARWNGASWDRLPNGFDGAVSTIGRDAVGDLVVGGHFLSFSDIPTTAFLTKFDGSSWSAIGGGVNGPVHATATLPNGDLVVAGDFSLAGGTAVNRIARWDGGTWHALGAGFNFRVNDLAVLPGGDLIAAGSFLASGGQAMARVARWDGSNWHAMAGGMDAEVRDLTVLANGDLLAGGYFFQAGGVYAPFLAVWDGSGWGNLGSWPVWNVESVAQLKNGDLVAGGHFQYAGGVACNNLARWDGVAWSAVGDGIRHRADALHVLPNGDLIAAGPWETIRWDGVTSTPFAEGGIVAMAETTTGELAVGGPFVVSSPKISAYFGRIATSCPADVQPIATSCAGTFGPVTLTADGLPWTGTTYTSTATGFAPGALGIAILGLTSPNTPLSWLWSNTGPGCNQLASHDAILLTLPQGGAVSFAFVLPNDQAFVGLPLFHQSLQFEVDGGNNLQLLSGSNGLALVIGAF